MILEGTIHCSAPECKTSQHVGANTMAAGRLPGSGWVKTVEYGSGETVEAFCSWDCVLKYAATFEPPTIIPFGEGDEG